MRLSDSDLRSTVVLNRKLARNKHLRIGYGAFLVGLRIGLIILVVLQFVIHLFTISLVGWLLLLVFWGISEAVYGYLSTRLVVVFLGISYQSYLLYIDSDNCTLSICFKDDESQVYHYTLTPHQFEVAVSEVGQLMAFTPLPASAIFVRCLDDFKAWRTSMTVMQK